MTDTLQINAILNKKYAVSQEDAIALFSLVEKAVIDHKNLTLSFDGMEICSSIFLNNFLGKLYLSYGQDVDKFIRYVGIDANDTVLPNQLDRIRRRALDADIYRPIFDNAISKA